MIDRLPRENPDSPAPGGEGADNVAPEKSRGARDRDQPTHDERGTGIPGAQSEPNFVEATLGCDSPSREARYMSRARMRLNLPEDVRGKALCETSTTSQLRPALARTTSATALRNASRGAASDVRHWTRRTTRSASCSSTEKATTSPWRTPSI